VIAVDTNVIVRLLVNDDAGQARRAKALFERERVFVSPTVLLETEWVLRSAYALDSKRIVSLLRALMGLPGVTTDQPQALADALGACDNGLDFADALHMLLGAGPKSGNGPRVFYSFDARLRRRAARQLPGVPTAAP
jgi:predicted nucleic-acid-binding protein